MGLSASMWSGVSGLLAHGERMNVVGNNIANVNTLGFKGQRMDFQDYIYQDSYSASGLTQIGRGVGISAVMGDFSQGAFEQTTEVTDLAIGGRGFFKVKPIGTETEYFTRAGNFRFEKDGTLTNPTGYALQGWKIDNTQGPTRATGQQVNSLVTTQVRGSGLPTDVKLDTWTVEPLQTTKISFNVSLDKKSTDKSVHLDNPFASLLNTWNGKQPPVQNVPELAQSAYEAAVPIKVYDEAGGVHTLTMYLDKVNDDTYKSGSPKSQIFEYVLAMEPSEDLRRVAVPNQSWAAGAVDGLQGTAQAAGSVFNAVPTDPAAGASRNWDGQLKAAFPLNPIYSFNQPPAAGKIGLDPTKPNTWPADTFTGTTWPAADASGAAAEVIVDMKNTKMGGVLMTGTISFDTLGNMVNQTAYVLNGSNKPIKDTVNGGFLPGNGYTIDEANNPVPRLDPNNPAAYMYPTEVSSTGYPMIVANFTGVRGADTVGSVPDADRYLIEVNMGVHTSNTKQPWQSNGSLADLEPAKKFNPYFKSANKALGPVEYSAANRVINPNYANDIPANGPQYIYANPNYDETLNTVVPLADGTYNVTINSPKYLYPNDLTTPGLSLPKATFNYDPAVATTWPADLAGIASLNTTTNKIEWKTGKATEAVLSDPTRLANMTEPTLKENNAFNATGESDQFSTSQNGYGRGDLQNWTVNAEGILSGVYSNGVTLPLYQVAIYDFTCKQGLRREGGNLFSETMESGQASVGTGGSGGLGTVNAQMLEGSNVDLSREFVNMITTQRGFQSNSKIITTVDTMMDVVVNMKR